MSPASLPSSEIPDLRILPLELLEEHEYQDPQRSAPLIKRIQADGVLRNPPVVSPFGEDDPRFVVLDGANRVTVFRQMGYEHILAQVVGYEPPQVSLYTWHHVIADLDVDNFLSILQETRGLSFPAMQLLDARARLAHRDLLAYVLCRDGRIFGVETETHDLHTQTTLLSQMVLAYHHRCTLFRAVADNLDAACHLYPTLTALVIFPVYDPAEVLMLTRDGVLLPAGLTRHLIQGRAMRLNYPLECFNGSEALETKNARLQSWLQEKSAHRAIRYYAEATYLFDE
ncbi:MAG: hypothetical protein ACOYYS_05365 [Chloroflexota bacterium]